MGAGSPKAPDAGQDEDRVASEELCKLALFTSHLGTHVGKTQTAGVLSSDASQENNDLNSGAQASQKALPSGSCCHQSRLQPALQCYF